MLMKRLFIPLLVAGFMLAVPMSSALHAARAEKVNICHVNSANDVLDLGDLRIVFGRQIEVSENALAAHEEHGDSTKFVSMDADFRDWVEQFYGIDLANADCFMFVMP
jgi:hypothetical protein